MYSIVLRWTSLCSVVSCCVVCRGGQWIGTWSYSSQSQGAEWSYCGGKSTVVPLAYLSRISQTDCCCCCCPLWRVSSSSSSSLSSSAHPSTRLSREAQGGETVCQGHSWLSQCVCVCGSSSSSSSSRVVLWRYGDFIDISFIFFLFILL